ncbi:hypothetical protein NWT09_27860 [Mycolicibacterium sp. jd]|uniref:Uncharacterized protein n=2 Tax=Mycobacteriaceae TaxID=1762 RepID=A0A1Y0CGN9_9MYCO|nr:MULTISPECIES: hypothetical protein [Mycobacteriaceae]ART74459.1 hypothetical protein BTO20_38265 [Mycobacterium dioxanotrophicus]MDN4517309.1 hypothetical protein [Mycolicibacterium austroafricanum]UJL30654.1 hypothetical protein HZU38_09665 [Mycolicibacterium vanbaalenii]WND56240.1 hypothetical protein QQA43_26690 [Mycolicibacterium vanbaalenii]
MMQQVYLAHGGQMTGDEMALIGVGLAGSLIIPMVAVAYIFMQKRSASEGAADDATPSQSHPPSATHFTTADWEDADDSGEAAPRKSATVGSETERRRR